MIIGHTHHLSVSRTDPDTIWLEYPHAGELVSKIVGKDAPSEIALPFDDAPGSQPGDQLHVFVYSDSDANPVATTKMPAVQLGQCANLKVRSVTELGAFLEWGIGKDLFMPFSEQRRPVQENSKESIVVYLDNSGRLAASSKLDTHFTELNDGFSAWQSVSLLLYQRTDLGFKCIVDNRAIGLLYKDEIFTEVKVGQLMEGFVKRLRQDRRIDLALQPPGNQLKNDLGNEILSYLQQHEGVSLLTDKSPPEAIYAAFGVSKKNFKRALSALYKQRRIIIEPDRVVLVGKEI